MTRKSKIIAAAVVTLLTTFGAILINSSEKPVETDYLTASLEKATIGNSITATGTIEPVTEVEVGTQVSGIIDKLFVDYNSVVRKGQIIAELDKTNLTSQLNSAQNERSSTKSDLDYQTINHRRMKALYDKGLISDNDYESTYLSYKKAQDTYASRNEAVKTAQTNLGYATITSPIDGVVISKAVEEGQTVAASFSTPTLFTIAKDLTDMRVIAKVDEADIGEVREGQRVAFTVDAYPDDTFNGKVTQVRQQGTTESNVVTYEVVISAPNAELKLKPELTANVVIYTLERKGVLSVPSKALRFTPTKDLVSSKTKIIDCEGKNKVWVRGNNTLRAYAVKVGVTGNTRTEILGGLPDGSNVVTEAKKRNGRDAMANNEMTEKSPFSMGPPNKKKSGSTTNNTTK